MNDLHLNLPRRTLLIGTAAMALPAWAHARTEAPLLTPRPLVFPRDHGSHNETRTEWWYLTGQARDAQGREFGFQVTFFRSRIDGTQALQSRLAAKQLLFAHAAITDVQGGRLWHEQRMGRWNGEAPAQRERGVFASTDDTDVALRDWRLRRGPDGTYTAQIQSDTLRMALQASPVQPLLLQGDQGFSRKGPSPSQASFYVSHPQLAVRGTLGLQGQAFEVQGTAWLDHEWSEALMHPDAVGWDWIGMNLDGGHSLTAFQLRRQDGTPLWAGGSFRAGGSTDVYRFNPAELQFVPQRHWTSPRTGARYPVEWRIRTPAQAVAGPPQGGLHPLGGPGTARVGGDHFYTVKAVIDPQELDGDASTGTVYWEGLSDLFDSNGARVGRGYLEMTGYTKRLVL